MYLFNRKFAVVFCILTASGCASTKSVSQLEYRAYNNESSIRELKSKLDVVQSGLIDNDKFIRERQKSDEQLLARINEILENHSEKLDLMETVITPNGKKLLVPKD